MAELGGGIIRKRRPLLPTRLGCLGPCRLAGLAGGTRPGLSGGRSRTTRLTHQGEVGFFERRGRWLGGGAGWRAHDPHPRPRRIPHTAGGPPVRWRYLVLRQLDLPDLPGGRRHERLRAAGDADWPGGPHGQDRAGGDDILGIRPQGDKIKLCDL